MAEAPFRVLRRARDAYVNGMTGIAGGPVRLRSDQGTEGAVARSQSLGIARIDENEACDFSGDVVGGPFWPRSRSCAEVENRVGGFLP
ncbi:unnamed protein product [Spirodela intermedia]|uniref:Uncharacterized protein n=1 Tax=Spirodela intermedia TaxID=51605 RepID=A0A7I8IYF2_SPIIN|nr:unnamed protein product [Spirodela intermedia]CAA6663036.1 unnamed protein product [Spirodela intermedia]